MLRRIDADVVALQEVREVDRIRDLAEDLGMAMFLGEPSDPDSPMHTAILTRLPVRGWRNRRHHGRMLRSHLHCDIETGGSELPLFPRFRQCFRRSGAVKRSSQARFRIGQRCTGF